jgi:poly(3-hydroxybutyrate) depolymerase
MHKNFRTRAALLVVLLSAPTAWAQAPAPAQAAAPRRGVLAVLDTLPVAPSHARIQARSYDFKEAGRPMNYELFVPSNYNRTRPTPLIVALHCLSSNARDMIRYESLTELAEQRGYIVVAPMGYNERGWYGSRGTGQSGRGNAGDPANLGELSELDVLNVLGLVQKEFNVDPRRTYLMGHSMGGGGTFYLGAKYAEKWAALGAAAPAINAAFDGLDKLKATPVIVIQGDQDALVNVNTTRQWVEKMKGLGIKHTYVEIAGGDHMAVIARNPENMRKVFDLFDAASRPELSR